MDPVRWEHEALENHFGQDLPTRNKMNSLYRISSVCFILFRWLRRAARRRLTGDDIHADNFVVDLGTSGLDWLYAEYAFNLTLPYVVALAGQCSVTMIIISLATL